jgi:hypothetical protein
MNRAARTRSVLVAGSVWCALLVSAVLLLALPALYFGHRWNSWLISDYFALFVPLIVWVFVTARGKGHQSLSHVVELLFLVVLMPALVSVRIFSANLLPLAPESASFGVLLVGVAVAILLRVFTPFLPE